MDTGCFFESSFSIVPLLIEEQVPCQRWRQAVSGATLMVSFSTLHGKSVFRCNDCRNNFYQGKLPSLPVLQEKGAFIVAPPANLIFAQPWGSSISAPGDRNDTILSVSILQCTVFIRCQTEMRDIGCISFYLDEKLRILLETVRSQPQFSF